MAKKKRRSIIQDRETNMNAVSMTGVTGLTPSLPMDGHEWVSYRDIETLAPDETVKGDPEDTE